MLACITTDDSSVRSQALQPNPDPDPDPNPHPDPNPNPNQVEAFAEEAAELQSADIDGTGVIDEMELRTFIAAKKKEGVLAPGVDTNIQRRAAALSP